MSEIAFCAYCGSKHIEDAGTVFIEDGPYNGQYYNEGQYQRLVCLDCHEHFGDMPAPCLCTKCGERVSGELGEDCDQDPEHDGMFLCETCMISGGPNE